MCYRCTCDTNIESRLSMLRDTHIQAVYVWNLIFMPETKKSYPPDEWFRLGNLASVFAALMGIHNRRRRKSSSVTTAHAKILPLIWECHKLSDLRRRTLARWTGKKQQMVNRYVFRGRWPLQPVKSEKKNSYPPEKQAKWSILCSNRSNFMSDV